MRTGRRDTRLPTHSQVLQNRFYQDFGVRPGDKDRGVYQKIKAPEFLAAQDIGRAFPGDSAVY